MVIDQEDMAPEDFENLALAVWCRSHKIPLQDFLRLAALQFIRNFESMPETDKAMIMTFELSEEHRLKMPKLDNITIAPPKGGIRGPNTHTRRRVKAPEGAGGRDQHDPGAQAL